MPRPNWTECEDGWSSGPYLIETLGGSLWVLSRRCGSGERLLTSSDSPSELEAFTAIHQEVSGVIRPLVLGSAYLVAIAGVVAGSVSGSSIAVVVASLVTVGVMAKIAEYMTGRRVVQARMPVSVR